MSRREPKKYLYDILSGCEFLLEFTRGKNLTSAKYAVSGLPKAVI